MYKDVFLLLGLDLSRLLDFYRRKTISRLALSAANLALILLVGIGIGVGVGGYFSFVDETGIFGQLVASYILKASLLTASWLSFWSAVFAIFSVTKLSSDIENLVVWGIKKRSVGVYSFAKSLTVSLFWTGVILWPAALGLRLQLTSFKIWWMSILIVGGSSVLSIILVYLLSIIKLNRKVVAGLGLFMFVSGSVWLVRTIIPHSIVAVSDAEADVFVEAFQNLPLNILVPNYVIEPSNAAVWLSGWLLLALMFLVVPILGKIVNSQTGASQISRTINIFPPRMTGLINKEVLAVIRSGRNMIYAAVMILMMVFFFYLLTSGRYWDSSRFKQAMAGIGVYWLLFYVAAYSLRTIYPLAASEKKTLWWYLTIPVRRNTRLIKKWLAGWVIAFPAIAVAGALWLTSTRPDLFVPTFFGAGGIVLVQNSIGTLLPDYVEGDDPEKLTSGWRGILVTLSSLGFGFVISYLV